MNKEDKITAEEIVLREMPMISQYNKNRIAKMMTEFSASQLPVQEQTKREVTKDEKHRIYCIVHDVKHNGLPVHDGVDEILKSLPQEQKDKVTGVRDEEKKDILNAMCVGALNKSLDDLKKIGLNDKVCNKISENFNFLKPVILA